MQYDPEEQVTCPYCPAETVCRKRLETHLVKCRERHPRRAMNVIDCPYNIFHKIPRDEFEDHVKWCENRVDVDLHDYVMDELLDGTQEIINNTRIPVNIPVIEPNWDDECVPDGINILENIKLSDDRKNIPHFRTHLPPHQMKKSREEDRRRFRERERLLNMSRASTPSSQKDNFLNMNNVKCVAEREVNYVKYNSSTLLNFGIDDMIASMNNDDSDSSTEISLNAERKVHADYNNSALLLDSFTYGRNAPIARTKDYMDTSDEISLENISTSTITTTTWSSNDVRSGEVNNYPCPSTTPSLFSSSLSLNIHDGHDDDDNNNNNNEDHNNPDEINSNINEKVKSLFEIISETKLTLIGKDSHKQFTFSSSDKNVKSEYCIRSLTTVEERNKVIRNSSKEPTSTVLDNEQSELPPISQSPIADKSAEELQSEFFKSLFNQRSSIDGNFGITASSSTLYSSSDHVDKPVSSYRKRNSTCMSECDNEVQNVSFKQENGWCRSRATSVHESPMALADNTEASTLYNQFVLMSNSYHSPIHHHSSSVMNVDTTLISQNSSTNGRPTSSVIASANTNEVAHQRAANTGNEKRKLGRGRSSSTIMNKHDQIHQTTRLGGLGRGTRPPLSSKIINSDFCGDQAKSCSHRDFNDEDETD